VSSIKTCCSSAIARDAERGGNKFDAGAWRGAEQAVPDEYEAGRFYADVGAAAIKDGARSPLAIYNAKKHIPRRRFLKSAGCTLALPLDAMMPASTVLAATAATPKPRFVASSSRTAWRLATGNRARKVLPRSCRTS
jgi:hypothetical protein